MVGAMDVHASVVHTLVRKNCTSVWYHTKFAAKDRS